MYFPITHELVQVQGMRGVFRVLHANYDRKLVDLVHLHSECHVHNIPFSLVSPRGEQEQDRSGC